MSQEKSQSSSFFTSILSNHVLANLLFLLVIILGTLSYTQLPRQQDPSINFNWIQITTIFPGASASDIEKKVTNILEKGLKNLKDVKFVSSNSREGISSILIRFNDVNTRTFDKRLSDLRRIIQQKNDELPEDALEPNIFEITSSNAFPSATLVLNGENNGEQLHFQARRIESEIGRMKRVDRVNPTGLLDPQIRINYDNQTLNNYGLTVENLTSSIRMALQDIAPGDINHNNQSWLVRLLGVDKTPQKIAEIPIFTPTAEINLGSVAQVQYTRSEATSIVQYNNKPSILFAVMKKDNENTLKLVQELTTYVKQQNKFLKPLGFELSITDDQTEITRTSINIMQNNLFIGLLLVLLVTWLFLGTKIAIITTISIPFTIAGVFIVLNVAGFTLNTSVLLGIVIALGMLVDDAIVVIETIYFKMRSGINNISAILSGIKEVVAPVTTSVLTTISAFLPLMLMPGILGKFMLIVPLVVTIALAISLIEAYWLLPSHAMLVKPNFKNPGRVQTIRNNFLKKLQYYYGKIIIRLLRHPILCIFALLGILSSALYVPATGLIKFDFFASDTIRLFYINVYMPPGTPVTQTMSKVQQISKQIHQKLPTDEYRSIVNYAGLMFTQTEPFIGKRYGQIQVSLKSKEETKKLNLIPREVEDIIEPLRDIVEQTTGVQKTSFLTLAGGPPASKPIGLKLLGSNYQDIFNATQELKAYMKGIPSIKNIADDAVPGAESLEIKLNYPNLRELGISSQYLIQAISSLIDGILLTSVNINNEQVDVRLSSNALNTKNDKNSLANQLLNTQIIAPDGNLIALRELININIVLSKEIIKHYNFDLAITIEADIDETKIDTIQANNKIKEHWKKIKPKHPNVSLDFSGQLDDIQESLDAMLSLFIMGIGLMYLILGTQFRSYIQPLIVLTAIPMAITGVIIGTLITGYALSLFALYGIVALSGISLNASIVMIATANRNRKMGIPKIRAIFYAAKRRLTPILITTMTTVAGLFSLAIGLGGKSLIWGPVASAIVFGLIISAILTTLFLPVIYACDLRCGTRKKRLPKKTNLS
jgi:multidrug efflux pump subunit AcrB